MGWSKCSSNDSRKLRAATSAPAPAKTVARRLPFLLSFSDCPSPVAYRLIVHCHRQWIARVNFSTILRHAKSIIAILTICVRLSASSSCYRLRHVHARCNCACTDSVHPITRLYVYIAACLYFREIEEPLAWYRKFDMYVATLRYYSSVCIHNILWVVSKTLQ